jgi:hypothetical protein
VAGSAGRRGRQGRQRRADGGRKKYVQVKATEEEYEALKAKADQLGVSVPRLLMQSALYSGGGTLPERHALYRELAALRIQLIKLGTNMNQLAHHANANEGELRPEMGPALTAARTLIQRTEAVMAALPLPARRAPSRGTGEVAKR